VNRRASAFSGAFVLSLLSALAAPFTAADPAVSAPTVLKETTTQQFGTIVGLDRTKRTAQIRGEDGQAREVDGRQVARFDDLHVGDRVAVVSYQATAVRIGADDGASAKSSQQQSHSYVAPANASPAMASAHTGNISATVLSVDPSGSSITFRQPDGQERTQPVDTGPGREFVRTLKPDQAIQVLDRRSVSISVDTRRR
jgi:hypothetical protein